MATTECFDTLSSGSCLLVLGSRPIPTGSTRQASWSCAARTRVLCGRSLLGLSQSRGCARLEVGWHPRARLWRYSHRVCAVISTRMIASPCPHPHSGVAIVNHHQPSHLVLNHPKRRPRSRRSRRGTHWVGWVVGHGSASTTTCPVGGWSCMLLVVVMRGWATAPSTESMMTTTVLGVVSSPP